jgi:ribose transport system permease protein
MTDVSLAAAERRSAAGAVDILRLLGRYGGLLVLLVMVVTVAAIEPDTFATKANLIGVLNQGALTAIIAMGVTFPLVAGEFDLSVGYAASLCGVIACELMLGPGMSIPAAFALAAATGAVVGLVNGFITTKMGVHSIITTLGVGTLVVGVNYAIAGGLPVALEDPEPFIQLTFGELFGIPYPVYVMALTAVVLWLILNRTVVGQSMQAVGGNAVAARLSGIRVDRVRVIAFVIAGVAAALTGILLASRTGNAAVDGGDTYLLSAYAAAFFGSAVLRDGQFHILGNLIGVFAVAVGFNAIALLGLSTYWQYLFQGSLLILGVGVGTLARRRAG